MKTIQIFTSQGVAADLTKYTLCSGQFSSCAPVVLYDSGTHMCGLYHWGAGELDTTRATDLKRLFEWVKPTAVYIFCGLKNPMSGKKDHRHVAGVKQLIGSLAQDVRSRIQQIQDHGSGDLWSLSCITVSSKLGAINFEKGLPSQRDYVLKWKSVITQLPNDVKFTGEDDDNELKIWI